MKKPKPSAANVRLVSSVDSAQPDGDADAAQEPVSAPPAVTREELIRQRAYGLYESRHGERGAALDDWLEAERLVDLDAGVGLQAY